MPLVPVLLAVTALTLFGLVLGFDRDLAVFALLGLGATLFFVYLAQRGYQRQLETLRQRVAALESAASAAAPPADAAFESPADAASPASAGEAAAEIEATPAAELAAAAPAVGTTTEAPRSRGTAEAAESPWRDDAVEAPPPGPAAARAASAVDHFEAGLRRVGGWLTGYFTDGNLFVRIGILVLFVGVAFLLKYAAEHSSIPLEFRFAGAGLGGLALLVLGWRLRARRAVYALLLQGAGIGVIYLTIFAAYRLADLLPPTLTFGLLLAFAALTVALALLQDSKALAVFAVLGGFLAPLLAASGSGNYIGLFSYYSVLNAAVFALAWWRAWRVLNLLGFAFTFGVFALWMLFDYRDAYLYPALAFLALFLLAYSLIGVLYALRQPHNMTGLVDGTLVFGTPVIASSLAMAMLHEHAFGIALASAGLGIYYLGLAAFAWRRIGEDLRLLAEALLAIGVVFATLAIPYALDGQWSSAAWALEGAGILWVALRQRRIYAQCFALVLQLAAGALFYFTLDIPAEATPWLNQAFMGGVFIALGGLISARLLYLQADSSWLRPAHLALFPWGLGWWLASAALQIDAFGYPWIPSLLTLLTLTAGALVYCDRLRGWDWRPAAIAGALLLPALLPIALAAVLDHGHLLRAPDGYFWVAALLAAYWMITRLESVDWPAWVNIAAHTLFVVFVASMLSLELDWQFERRLQAAGEGFEALLALAPLVALYLALAARLPAIARLGDGLRWSLVTALSLLLTLWCIAVNLGNSGASNPLPYLPLLNPLDLANLALFVLLLEGVRRLPAHLAEQGRPIRVLIAALVFLWLTAMLIRSLHHALDIRFDFDILLGDTRVQTAISILWTIIGIAAMWFAAQRARRPLWIAGAVLVGIVLLKMLFVDLGASGTIERIVSFLVVGSLLVGTGYFSPIPPRRGATAGTTGDSTHA